MTTFAGWLSDQAERRDAVGELARLWADISPGRISGLAGVTKHLQEHAEREVLSWIPEAIRVTTEEFRRWKANPEASSVHAPAVASQLDRIEHMLRAVIDALGIPLVFEVNDGPDAQVLELTDVTTGETRMVPVITSTGLGHVEAGSRLAEVIGPDGKPDWQALYSYADHAATDEE